MTISSLIRKDGLIKHMTATSATVATPESIHVDSVAKVATVAVAMSVRDANFKENLTKFVHRCCVGLPVTTQQVIDNLLSIDDELDIINGAIPVDSLRLHIQLWIESDMPYYSGKIAK